VTALFDVPANPSHPAKYTDVLLPVMAKMLKGSQRILDPFAGTGKVFELQAWLPDAQIEAIELEPEFAAINPRTRVGNALHLPWPDDYFDAIVTSPTYANRLADSLRPPDKDCFSYAQSLQRPLHIDNSGRLQWGSAYWAFHHRAWTEARRALQTGGRFVLNFKDHYRNKKLVPATEWHIYTLESLGFRLLQHERIATPSLRYGANHGARVEHESVILFELQGKGVQQ
jgi:SAM-dependent methyltransferase